MRLVLTAILLCLVNWALAGDTGSRHAVILLYHHVSGDTPPSTSVTPKRFRRHLDYLADNGYRVIPLERMLDALYNNGDTVPDNAVAITFDDAYESVYTEAWTQLRRRDWPFTVFVANNALDRGYSNYMSWDQLREMAGAGVAIGGHSESHGHLVRRASGETERAWQARVNGEIRDNVARLEEQLGIRVKSFAYPFGEYNRALEELVADAGLYGLAQHSGAVGPETAATRIPRFPMATGFANMDRFATAVAARPLPVTAAEGGPAIIDPTDPPERLTLELKSGPYRADQLACYSSAGGQLDLTLTGETVEIALPPFRPGRNKINCTAPSTERSGEFFWYSHLWLSPRADGSWPEE